MPAWWGARSWLSVTVPLALADHGGAELLRAHEVARDTVLRVARLMAEHADHRTGRDCRPGNDRLAELAGYSVRQVQRARGALRAAGVVVETLRGKNWLTRAERLGLWAQGSPARRLAGTFALIAPRRPQARATPVDGVTLPGSSSCEPGNSLSTGVLQRHRPKDERCARPLKDPKAERGPTPDQVRAHKLIAGVQRRVSWLTGVSPRRLACLHRFAAQRWTEGDVLAAIHDTLRARGWTVPGELDQPAAYLAGLLRDVDVADRPGALSEARDQADERERFGWLLAHGPACPHGQPAGDVPHPAHGRPTCPLCRAAGRQ